MQNQKPQQKRTPQQNDIQKSAHKKKRYLSTAPCLFYAQYVIDCLFCLAGCRYNKLVIILQNLQPAFNIGCTILKCSFCFNSQMIYKECTSKLCNQFFFAVNFRTKWSKFFYISIKSVLGTCRMCNFMECYLIK